MAYIRADIADYGTEDTLLQKVRDLFVNNTVAPFTLVSENFIERPYTFTVSYNNLMIEIASNANSATKDTNTFLIKFYIMTDGEAVQKTNSSVAYSSNVTASSLATRTLKFLIAKNGNDIVVNISPYTKSLGKGDIVAINITTSDNNEIIGYNMGASTITNKLTYLSADNQITLTARPYHLAQKTEGVLWLDPELTFYKSNAGEYYSLSKGITGLGGGTRLSTYTTAEGDKYYCCDTNIAIKLGEETVYTVEGG